MSDTLKPGWLPGVLTAGCSKVTSGSKGRRRGRKPLLMTPHLRRLALLTAVFCQGCVSCLFPSPSPPVCGGGSTTFGIPPAAEPEPVHAAGQPVLVTLSFESGYQCSDSAPPTVTSVNVELSDPDNRPVAVVASVPVKKAGLYGNEVWETTLSFTPTVPGSYHALATFEPGVGLVQRDVWVVNDRRGEAAATGLGGPGCVHLERTALGSVVCQQQTGEVTLHRNGMQAASWPFGTGHVAGDVIWVQGGSSGLTRNLDTGAGAPTLTASAPASLGEEVFAATENDALVWANDRLKLLHFTGGTFSTDAEVELSIPVGPRALAFSRDGASLVVADWDKWARLDLPPGLSTPTPSWTENEAPAFQASDGLWVAVDPTTFRFVPADKRKPMATLVAPPGWKNSLLVLTQVGAGELPLLFPVRTSNPNGDGYSVEETIDKTQVLVPRVNGSQIQLTAFSAPAGASFVEVSQGYLRAARGNESSLWKLEP
jgi:hypothetical protein